MNVTLGDFEIADGLDRIHQTVEEESFSVRQQTQVETPLHGGWPVAFYDRAALSIPLRYRVVFPECEDTESAVLQSRQVPILCPKGGELVEYHLGIRNTYADAWRDSVEVERLGVRNIFTFVLTAVDPTTVSLVLDEESGILEDEEGGELEY